MIHSTVTVRRTSDPSRWVCITMNLRPMPAGKSFVEYATGFHCQIEPADTQAAQEYQEENWRCGVLSGLGYAWRRWLRPDRGVFVSELRGHLGYGDIEGIAAAALIAVCELLGEQIIGKSDWYVDQSPLIPTTATPVSAGVVAAQS